MNKGFTLVELIAVIVILSILMIITTPAYSSISTNIKTRNYESKKSTIKAQTLSYVEKYMKNDVYDGNDVKSSSKTYDEKQYTYTLSNKTLCFTPDYLIQNGIISSDNETDEYIENDITGEKYKGSESENVYIKIYYDVDSLKLKTIVIGEKIEIKGYSADGSTRNIELKFGDNEFECTKIDGENG